VCHLLIHQITLRHTLPNFVLLLCCSNCIWVAQIQLHQLKTLCMIMSCHSEVSCFIARISGIEMLRYFQMYLVISVKQPNWFHFMSLFGIIQEVYGRAETSAPRLKLSLLNHLECHIKGKPAKKYSCSGRAFLSSPNPSNPYPWWRQGACRKWRLTNLTCKPKEWKACSFFIFFFS